MKKMKSETNEHVLTMLKRNERTAQDIKLVALRIEMKSGEKNESVLTLLKRNENSARLLS